MITHGEYYDLVKSLNDTQLLGKGFFATETAYTYLFGKYQLSICYRFPGYSLYKNIYRGYGLTSRLTNSPITIATIDEVFSDKDVSDDIKNFFIFNLDLFSKNKGV